MWNGTDDKGWWYDLIWGDIWIRHIFKDALLTYFEVLRGLLKYVTGSFQDKFEELCGLEHMIQDDVLT
jgi:hypothetical protein